MFARAEAPDLGKSAHKSNPTDRSTLKLILFLHGDHVLSRKLKPQPKLTVAKKQPPRWQRERNISLLIRIIIPLIIVITLGLVGYWGYDNYVAPWQQTVAKVNDTTIDMRYFVKMLRYEMFRADPQSPEQVLSTIMRDELIRQGATKLGIEVSPEEITERIKEGLLAGQGNATQPEIDLEQYYKQVKDQTGLSETEYRKIVETELLIPEIREYLKEQRVPSEAKQIRLFALERPSEEEALEASVELQKGNATLEAELAAGDLGWVPEGIYLQFDEVAFGLSAGNVSEPILTDQGYYIIKVSEIDESRPVEDAYHEILADREFENWFQEERDASIIEEYLNQDKITWAVNHI